MKGRRAETRVREVGCRGACHSARRGHTDHFTKHRDELNAGCIMRKVECRDSPPYDASRSICMKTLSCWSRASAPHTWQIVPAAQPALWHEQSGVGQYLNTSLKNTDEGSEKR